MSVTQTFSDPGVGPTTTEIAPIPASHLELIDEPYWVALTTVMPNGQPQTTPVWCNREGDYVLINTMRGFRKEKNMRANPHVTLLVYDPSQPTRNLEVRGRVVEMSEVGAVEHNDHLTQLYLGKPAAHFFGDAVPVELAKIYVPVKITIAPTRVRADDPAPAAALRASSGLAPFSGPYKTEEADKAVSISRPVPARVAVPDSHQDLLSRPVHGILSTMLPDGQPQSSLVWVDYDGTDVLINTALERRKCTNLLTNPCTVLP